MRIRVRDFWRSREPLGSVRRLLDALTLRWSFDWQEQSLTGPLRAHSRRFSLLPAKPTRLLPRSVALVLAKVSPELQEPTHLGAPNPARIRTDRDVLLNGSATENFTLERARSAIILPSLPCRPKRPRVPVGQLCNRHA